MTSTDRWRPPLPSLGRLGGAPVAVGLSANAPLELKLKRYYTDRRSVSDFFEVRIQPHVLEKVGIGRSAPGYLSEFTPSEQVHLILSSLYYKASNNFKLKLKLALSRRKGLNHIRQWFHTANAAVLPYLISGGEDYQTIDHLTRWCLENCANNYAQFIKDWKSLKKAMRKAFALGKRTVCKRSMRTYYEVFSRKENFESPHQWGSYVLLWTQTRACGLADGKMISESVEKFISTVTTPSKRVVMDPSVLQETVKGAIGIDGRHARISVGTTACLESTRKEGGKSAYLSKLTRSRVIRRRFDFKTLEPTPCEPSPVRSSEDVLHWAVDSALTHRTYTRCIRLHTVVEPGKARTITVAPYAYQVLMGVFAHMFQSVLRSKGLVSGLTRDRHLWRFLSDTMNPQATAWEHLSPGEDVYGLSTDWSEATDYGDPYLARQIWTAFIQLARSHSAFPDGLAVLAMNLYCGRRFVFVPVRGGFKLVVTSRGWFMGDMMTKVILTVVHDYTMRAVGLKVYSIVGDDEVVLSNDKARLARHLSLTEALDVKVSRDDTFVSRRLLFYCEEGSLVPQKPSHSLHVSMRRGAEISYMDYPRIRLLLNQTCETDTFSMTNVGRFSLLGKESRWVYSVNPSAVPHFETAGVLQHILVPQDADCISPYVPLEIGGDGAFSSDPNFLYRVVHDKSREPREVLFRMDSLMKETFSFKFVRSERLNEVVHKHHLLLPALESIGRFLPENAKLIPKDDTQRAMLESVRVRGLENPQQTWLRLCRGFYWKEVFEGRVPHVPTFDIQRRFSAGHTEDPSVDMYSFMRHWANPGFRFANHDPYFVLRDEVETMDPLSLNWKWEDLDALQYPKAFHIYSSWMEDVDWLQRSLDDIINLVRRGTNLPDRLVKRLNLFMESDTYILSTLPKEHRDEFYIVTRDFRLCAEIQKRYSRSGECWVYALDPSVYLTGRYAELSFFDPRVPRPDDDPIWVEDPGAILHVDYTEFTDGFPHDEGIWDKPVRLISHKYYNCVAVINASRF